MQSTAWGFRRTASYWPQAATTRRCCCGMQVLASNSEPLAGHNGTVEGLAFAPAGDRFATASGDGKIRICTSTSRVVIAELVGHRNFAKCVAYSPDGKWIASGGRDGEVHLWSTTTSGASRKA